MGFAVFLAVAAIFLATRQMGFHTSRLDLLNPHSDYNQLWLEYLEQFGDGDDAVIVVQSDDRKSVAETLDELAESLTEDDRNFRSVLHRIDMEAIEAKGLYYLSLAELTDLERSLDEIQPLLDGDWSQVRLDHQLRAAAMAATVDMPITDPQQHAALEHLNRLSQTLDASFQEDASYISPWQFSDVLASGKDAQMGELAAGGGRMMTDDGRMGFILLRLVHDEQQLDPTGRSLARLRDAVARTQAERTDVSIGLTGLPVMESDEMQASQKDMIQASVISLIGVACLFIAGLGGVRHPLLTIGTLLISLAWSFGFITIAVGHLNILSVAFGVILIGLGIDFGIHYIARYLQLRASGRAAEQAITETASSVGPGVCVGALTTAIAFFAAYFTDFTGVAELGVIAGGGILLCLVATIVVLPALIYLVDYRSTNVTPARPLPMQRLIEPLLRFPTVTLFVGFLVTGVIAAGVGRLTYDHNLLNLQPAGVKSVALERMLLEESEHSVWYAISTSSSREELFERKKQLQQLPSVERTEEILSLLPENADRKTPVIARIRSRLGYLPDEAPLIPVAQPGEIRQIVAAAGVALAGDDPNIRTTQKRLSLAGDRLVRMENGQVLEHVSGLQQALAVDLLTRLKALRDVTRPEPPSFEDLPQSLVDRFVGKDSRHLLKVYGRGDIWDMESLGTFVSDVKSVDPRATGQPLQTYYASHQMQNSYINAAWYALAAVTFVLLLDFRKLSLTALALVPVGSGMLQMFGVMGLLGIPLNPANMIALPLILGIGLDDGVHIVHDYRRQRGKFSVSASTVTAIVVTSLTTMIGFGSLMLASHQGLQSLGRVLTIGVLCCLFSSLVLQTALLRWISEGESPPEAEGDSSPAIADEPFVLEEQPATPADVPRRVA